MKEGRRCNGASPPRTLGRSWHAFTQHNHSGGVLEHIADHPTRSTHGEGMSYLDCCRCLAWRAAYVSRGIATAKAKRLTYRGKSNRCTCKSCITPTIETPRSAVYSRAIIAILFWSTSNLLAFCSSPNRSYH